MKLLLALIIIFSTPNKALACEDDKLIDNIKLRIDLKASILQTI